MAHREIIEEKEISANFVEHWGYGSSKEKTLPKLAKKKPLFLFGAITKHSVEGDRIDNFCYSSTIYSEKGVAGILFVNPSPTCNCQIYSLGNSEVIFNNFLTKEETLAVLTETHRLTEKNQILIDCKTHVATKVKELLGDYIVFEQNYKNTEYNTEMTMFLIKTDSFAIPKEEDDDDYDDY